MNSWNEKHKVPESNRSFRSLVSNHSIHLQHGFVFFGQFLPEQPPISIEVINKLNKLEKEK